MDRPLILVSDADQPFLDMMIDVLDDAGYDAITVNESPDTFDIIRTCHPALVMIDLLLLNPERSLTIVNEMRLDATTTTIPVIVCSTCTPLLHDNAAQFNAQQCAVLPKPFDIEAMLSLVERSLLRFSAEHNN